MGQPNDYEAWARKRNAAHQRWKEEPIPGVKLCSWSPPADWVLREAVSGPRVRGLQTRLLFFTNGKSVRQLIAPLHGFDDTHPRTKPTIQPQEHQDAPTVVENETSTDQSPWALLETPKGN